MRKNKFYSPSLNKKKALTILESLLKDKDTFTASSEDINHTGYRWNASFSKSRDMIKFLERNMDYGNESYRIKSESSPDCEIIISSDRTLCVIGCDSFINNSKKECELNIKKQLSKVNFSHSLQRY